MRQTMYVIRIENDEAIVQAERASSCGSCAGKASCGTLGAWKKRLVEIRLPNTLQANIGDEVTIEVSDHIVLKSAAYLYALPMLVFFIIGAMAYTLASHLAWSDPDAAAAIAGILGVIATYISMHGKQLIHMDAQMVKLGSYALKNSVS